MPTGFDRARGGMTIGSVEPTTDANGSKEPSHGCLD